MTECSLFDQIEAAAAAIRLVFPEPPRVGIVLGSGLGHLADQVEARATIRYASIPHFPTPTVVGHAGNLVLGQFGGACVAMAQGRFHSYEGHDLATVTFPVRVLRALGVSTLILTAATGGIADRLRPGDIVALSDHLNLIGSNPLRGPNDDRLGPRFADMTAVYSPVLRAIAFEEAASLGVPLESGVYCALPGPSYETPAEIRMLRTLGADVVGMSTVPEAIVARHAGMDVLAFALVTNAAAGITGEPISHAEVLEIAHAAGMKLGRIIERVVARMEGRTAEVSPAPDFTP